MISQDKLIPVYKYNIREDSLRNVSNEELIKFLEVGRLSLSASYSTVTGDGIEYILRGNISVLGGGKKDEKRMWEKIDKFKPRSRKNNADQEPSSSTSWDPPHPSSKSKIKKSKPAKPE